MAATVATAWSSNLPPVDKVDPLPELFASSPYLDREHLLDLNTLDEQSRLFALALSTLQPRSPEYATLRYENSLDLDLVLAKLKDLLQDTGLQWKHQDFYVVEFRSQLKPQIDNPLLFKLNKESHREANISGGLLKYWYGEPDAERRNLATCKCRNTSS
jgi:hypothetical protein